MIDPQKVIYPKLSYTITGYLFETHNQLGRYRNEQQYADAFEEILKENNVSYEREKWVLPSFTGESSHRNKVDFLIEDKIVIEMKAKTILTREDYYQIKRYLTSLHKELGILVNFRSKYISPKRILNRNDVSFG